MDPQADSLRLVLDVSLASAATAPINGKLADSDGEPRQFFGWLELMDLLEELRRGALETGRR